MDLIEQALRWTKQDLSSRVLRSGARQGGTGDRVDQDMRRIQDLLGRLHNQKVFYRPRKSAYIGG